MTPGEEESKVKQNKSAEISEEENKEKDRPITPVHGFTKAPIDSRIPSAMRAKPKIPRTPIPIEKLEQVKKGNEEFFKKAIYIQKSDQEIKKKSTLRINQEEVPMSSKDDDFLAQHSVSESTRKKSIKTEAKNRIPEEKKVLKEI